MVNGHKSAAHTDSPDGGTGKTCLGGGMHCPNASSFCIVSSAFSEVVAKHICEAVYTFIQVLHALQLH